MINDCHRGRSCDRAIEPAFAVYADPQTVLHLSGELDLDGAAAFAAALDPLTTRGGVILLDLADLTFMDSTGISLLTRYNNAASLDGFDLALVQGHKRIARLFSLTGLDEYFTFVTG